MVQSMNTKVDYTVAATSYLGMANYGKVMIGDKAFEFYNEKNLKDYIQIPWEEIDYVMASVNFKGKWIPRFAIVTKHPVSTYTNPSLLAASFAMVLLPAPAGPSMAILKYSMCCILSCPVFM